jgi:hypothetical protein
MRGLTDLPSASSLLEAVLLTGPLPSMRLTLAIEDQGSRGYRGAGGGIKPSGLLPLLVLFEYLSAQLHVGLCGVLGAQPKALGDGPVFPIVLILEDGALDRD